MTNVEVTLKPALPKIDVTLTVSSGKPVEQATMTLVSLIDGSINGINLPQSLTMIRSGAFSGCSNLKSIIVPENVDTIESDAFANSGITLINVQNRYKAVAGQPWGATGATVNWLKAKPATVTVIQSPNQTITVTTDDGVDHSESFSGYVGMAYTVKVVASEGYIAGTLSSTGGTFTGDTIISAEDAIKGE